MPIDLRPSCFAKTKVVPDPANATRQGIPIRSFCLNPRGGFTQAFPIAPFSIRFFENDLSLTTRPKSSDPRFVDCFAGCVSAECEPSALRPRPLPAYESPRFSHSVPSLIKTHLTSSKISTIVATNNCGVDSRPI